MIGRRLLLGAVGLPLFSIAARADSALTLLVGAAADSPEDHAARAFAPFLARHLPGTRIALANIIGREGPGNDGLAACRALLDAPPDGATLLWGVTPTLPAECLAGDDGALLDQIAFLGAVRREPVAFVSPALSRLATTRDMLRAADARGPALPLATPHAGSPPHLAALQLQALSQTPLAIVPFPSACAARMAVRAGTACAAALTLSDAIDDLRGARLVGLGITASSRVDVFPDIAPMADAGLAVTMTVLRGLAARPDLPDATQRRLRDALLAIAAGPEFSDEANADGFLVGSIDGAAWTAAARSDRQKLSALWPTAAHRTLEAQSQPG